MSGPMVVSGTRDSEMTRSSSIVLLDEELLALEEHADLVGRKAVALAGGVDDGDDVVPVVVAAEALDPRLLDVGRGLAVAES